MAVKVTPKGSRPVKSSRPSDEVEEIETTVEEATAEEATITEALEDLVKFALPQTIDPAPTVGRISLTRDMGITKLEKGIVTIPRLVAEHLADKGYGQIV